MIVKALAVQRVRLPVRNLRALGELAGLAREGLGQLEVAGPGGETKTSGRRYSSWISSEFTVERVVRPVERARKRPACS